MHYTRQSPSKINLFLKIAGKLSNGYHEIDTVFLPLNSPCDEITVAFIDAGGISITTSSDVVPCDERNLCWKAVDVYARRAGIEVSCTIHIEKHIPVAAGMGGGSSNAATVLTILNDKYQLLDKIVLAELALSLGADVPFFLQPCLSTATGVGEKLVPIDFDYPKLSLIIIAPHFPVSAAWAYKHCCVADDIAVTGQMTAVLDAVKTGNIDDLSRLVRNDLAIPSYKKFPILSIIKEKALESGALCVEVSGSGPTMFALCKSDQHAKEVASILTDSLPSSISILTV